MWNTAFLSQRYIPFCFLQGHVHNLEAENPMAVFAVDTTQEFPYLSA